MRIIIFIIRIAIDFPPRPVGNLWFRTYEDACVWIERTKSDSPFQIEKWSVPATADGGGSPLQKSLSALGVEPTVDAWERDR